MLISGREDASSRVAPQELCIFTPVPAVNCWGQEFFYDLTQFTEGKLWVGHLRTYGATLSVLHSESLTLFVQKGKRQKLGDLGTSCARNGYGALRRMT